MLLELLEKLQKHICRTVGPSLVTSLEPLAHRGNVAILSLFLKGGRSTHYSDRLHDFSVTIPRLLQARLIVRTHPPPLLYKGGD